jgi:hypothetical protein
MPDRENGRPPLTLSQRVIGRTVASCGCLTLLFFVRAMTPAMCAQAISLHRGCGSLLMCGGLVSGGTASNELDDARKALAQALATGTPTGSLPNPYQSDANWAKPPAGRKMGDLGSVSVDSKGNIWTIERCGEDSCAGSRVAPILEFDPAGNLVKSFGAGLLVFPHAVFVDKNDNVWVADERGANETELGKFPDSKGKGFSIIKFSSAGKVLMTLGTPGVPGKSSRAFVRPLSVVVGPKGDIFVADADPLESGSNGRIVKFAKDGTFIKAWGKRGSLPGEFNTPHALAMDSMGRLFVADRDNNRVQIFNQDGTFLAEWKQFGIPTGIFIDASDMLYVSDTQSDPTTNPGFTRGIRIGSTRDGVVKFLVPALAVESKDHLGRPFAGAEGVAADASGNMYASESRAGLLRKYVKIR